MSTRPSSTINIYQRALRRGDYAGLPPRPAPSSVCGGGEAPQAAGPDVRRLVTLRPRIRAPIRPSTRALQLAGGAGEFRKAGGGGRGLKARKGNLNKTKKGSSSPNFLVARQPDDETQLRPQVRLEALCSSIDQKRGGKSLKVRRCVCAFGCFKMADSSVSESV